MQFEAATNEKLVAENAALREEIKAIQTKAAEAEKTYQTSLKALLEAYRRLEAGLLGQKRERHVPNGEQLTLGLMSLALPTEEVKPEETAVAAHKRTSHGRKPLSDKLPRVDIEVLPPEVQQQGLNAFEKIGEDVSEVVERRSASVVVVRVTRPKFVLKETRGLATNNANTNVCQHEALELPIQRGIAGPALLAETAVRRFVEHQPLHRMERSFGREGLDIARSTLCGWHKAIADLATPLVDAMWKDAFTSPYLCADATGVLVQDKEKCRRAHFFVVVAPEKHALFGYAPKHNAEAVDALLGGYKGLLVADAHAVYNHLFESGDVIEAGCWAHCRRYFFKAYETDKARSEVALNTIQQFFAFERDWAIATPDVRLDARQRVLKPAVEAFFEWCDSEALSALDGTPLSKAVNYARNQRTALQTFLSHGDIPIHNNISERHLRREAVGRKNWLFVGSDEGGHTNAALTSLLASCEMHRLEPFAYLRDLLCLLPSWPVNDVLALSPLHWRSTVERADVVRQLEDNVFRKVSIER